VLLCLTLIIFTETSSKSAFKGFAPLQGKKWVLPFCLASSRSAAAPKEEILN
jgi:hypothetical protein